jgi:hypothetical protein
MREDMFELIIERPRGGNGPRRPGRPPRDLEDAPRFESSSRNRGGTKWLNENLAPLVRFLRSRVGRPWDEVHSEMAAQLSLKSAVQKHVLDHVWQMIELHAVLIDGRPYHPLGDHRGRPRPIQGYAERSFYVCPESRRLLLAPRWYRRPPPEPSPDRVRLDDTQVALRRDGIWYRVRLAPIPAARAYVRDAVLKRYLNERDIDTALYELYGRLNRYAVTKQQMSTNEIAKLARAQK